MDLQSSDFAEFRQASCWFFFEAFRGLFQTKTPRFRGVLEPYMVSTADYGCCGLAPKPGSE